MPEFYRMAPRGLGTVSVCLCDDGIPVPTIVGPFRVISHLGAIMNLRAVNVGMLCGVLAASIACSTTLDMKAIETSVTSGIESQLLLPVASVACPAETKKAKAGDTFECTVTPKDGGKATVKVTQSDDKGNVKWELVHLEGLLDLSLAEASIVKGLKEQSGVDATVSCGGGKLRAAKAGGTFDCTAKSDKGDIGITVTMNDATGNISWATK
jgi:hypothetical protein